MISHDSVVGHGHVASHAMGMAGGHWTHGRHCLVRKGTRTCCVGVSVLDIGHWRLHVQCVQRPLDTCRMVTENGLTLHPNFFDMCFVCHACAGHWQWTLCGNCPENFHSAVGIGRMSLLRGHYLFCVLDFMCEPMVGHIASGSAGTWCRAPSASSG